MVVESLHASVTSVAVVTRRRDPDQATLALYECFALFCEVFFFETRVRRVAQTKQNVIVDGHDEKYAVEGVEDVEND